MCQTSPWAIQMTTYIKRGNPKNIEAADPNCRIARGKDHNHDITKKACLAVAIVSIGKIEMSVPHT